MDLKVLHQTPEEIIKAATPEQRVLWNYIFLTYGEKCSIAQLFYSGATAGSEFLTYRARKMYFALQLAFSSGGHGFAAAGLVELYNEANAVRFTCSEEYVDWNTATVAHVYGNNHFVLLNRLFSRFTISHYNYVQFIGYRLIY